MFGAQLMMAFLVGVGSEEPLRFRLLPVDQYMNTGAALMQGLLVTLYKLLQEIHCSGP